MPSFRPDICLVLYMRPLKRMRERRRWGEETRKEIIGYSIWNGKTGGRRKRKKLNNYTGIGGHRHRIENVLWSHCSNSWAEEHQGSAAICLAELCCTGVWCGVIIITQLKQLPLLDMHVRRQTPVHIHRNTMHACTPGGGSVEIF